MAKFNIPFEIAIEYDSKDLEAMKFQDLQRTAAALSREARSRIKDLRKVESELGKSPALASFERWRQDSGMYSARYKTREQLYEEIREMKNFLDNDTSTVEGYKNYIKDIDESFGFETTKEFRDAYYFIFRELSEYFSQSRQFVPSEQVETMIREQIDSRLKKNKRSGDNQEITPTDLYSMADDIIRRFEATKQIITR